MIPLHLLTYNCGKESPCPLLESSLRDELPDEVCGLYVFALQEMCSVLDGCFPSLANVYTIRYTELVVQALNTKYGSQDVRFKTVCAVHAGAIALIVVLPYPLRVSHIRTATAPHGYGFTLLKGGVGIRLAYSEGTDLTELTFVGAHLPAHEGASHLAYRNQVAVDVLRGLDFGDGFGALKPKAHTFVMGDLNYRTTSKLDPSSEEMANLLALQDQLTLLPPVSLLVAKYDELSRAMAAGDVFMGFSEAKINFRPTYKYELDTAIYKRSRCPLWCDRIVFQSTYVERGALQIHRYHSLESVRYLDHRPVALHLLVPWTSPMPIISRGGYQLVVLHSEHEDMMVAPTEIYMKPTAVDTTANFLGRGSDLVLGSAVWAATTRKGRLLVLVAAVFYLGYWLLF